MTDLSYSHGQLAKNWLRWHGLGYLPPVTPRDAQPDSVTGPAVTAPEQSRRKARNGESVARPATPKRRTRERP